MSLNKLTQNTLTDPPAPNYPWMNIGCNTLSTTNQISTTGGIDMNCTGLTNVSSINNIPASLGLNTNPVNVIYCPTGPVVVGSNILVSWSAVISKAAAINVNQILNIYFDNSSISTCTIDISYDFQ